LPMHLAYSNRPPGEREGESSIAIRV
jgi:hypothetical protein